MQPCDQVIDPIQWWGTVPSKLKQLRLLADCYLHTPCSSVASEEEFSAVGFQISEKRNRLSPGRAETIMMVARNTNLIPDAEAAGEDAARRKDARSQAKKRKVLEDNKEQVEMRAAVTHNTLDKKHAGVAAGQVEREKHVSTGNEDGEKQKDSSNHGDDSDDDVPLSEKLRQKQAKTNDSPKEGKGKEEKDSDASASKKK
jgi:hypothetical protein